MEEKHLDGDKGVSVKERQMRDPVKPAETVSSSGVADQSASIGANDFWRIGMSRAFARLNKIITRDEGGRMSSPYKPSSLSKDKIQEYIDDPAKYEKELRKAAIYLYGASSHFRRLIQYFVGLTDFSYVVSPSNVNPSDADPATTEKNFREVLRVLSSMNIKTQFPKILAVCLREDVFYGTMWVTKDNITIQRLPSDYCRINSIEGNVPNVTFNFSYFDGDNEGLLDFFPKEFRSKYKKYKDEKQSKSRGRSKKRASVSANEAAWIELDSPTSFAVKFNSDIMEYPMPPFAGILGEVYDLDEYKRLKLSKTAIDNYAMLAMKLPMNQNGEFTMQMPQAQDFWMNLDSVLPDEIGSVLTPMQIEKIDFDKSGHNDRDSIAEAEDNLFTAAGVSSLLFNNDKASANALALSIKVDQEMTYSVVKSIGDVVNRFLKTTKYGKDFSVNFLNVSAFNRKEAGDQYLKAAQFGFPTLSMYAASQGLCQSEFDTMNFLENDVLGLKSKLIPLRSSSTMSSSDKVPGENRDNGKDLNDVDNAGGRPKKDGEELTDSGEQSAEDGDDW